MLKKIIASIGIIIGTPIFAYHTWWCFFISDYNPIGLIFWWWFIFAVIILVGMLLTQLWED